jgi:hypothetical protein
VKLGERIARMETAVRLDTRRSQAPIQLWVHADAGVRPKASRRGSVMSSIA